MSKLEWHGSGEREIESGVSQVALFPMSGSTYGTGVAWNGVTAINENPSGADVSDLYADNIKYASMRSAEKFGFTIEAYTYPDEWAECDGSLEAEDGAFLGQQDRKAFGLVYKTQIGDENNPGMNKGYKLHIIYNSTAAPSGRSYTTVNDNPDAISFSWEADSTPEKVLGSTTLKPVSEITIDSTKANSTKLNALLDTIYGRNADVEHSITELTPTLPLPAAVISAMT